MPGRWGASGWLVAAGAVLAAGWPWATARAFPQYPPLLPNRSEAMSINTGMPRPCITCHNNPDGGQGCLCPGGYGCPSTDVAAHTAPCFNPFGMAFFANNKVWNATLAALDSDGDGFTNGQELQDPTGAWVYLVTPPEPGVKSHVTRPGFPDDHPGLAGRDADGDRVCWYGRDLNMDGDCADTNENTTDHDCDDSDSQTHSMATELCTDTKDNDCNGLPTVLDPVCGNVVDNDLDGYCETGRDLNGNRNCLDQNEPGNGVDCDDTKSNVHSGAPENCIDLVDNDCDGAIDLDDEQCDPHDDDHDGYCPLGQDLNADHDCEDNGEQLSVSDCDDGNASISPDATESCTDGPDNDCDGAADLDDSECRHLVDGDLDGYCPQGQDLNGDGNCAGEGENNGSVDCDDDLATRNPGEEEVCFRPLDADCDGLAALDDSDCVIYLDQDGDGYCPAGQDVNHDGDCVDDNLAVAVIEYALTNKVDCDDSSAIAFPRNNTAEPLSGTGCFDGVDTDCDGRIDGLDSDCSDYADYDQDGSCRLGTDLSEPRDRDCTDPGESSEAVQDCDDADPVIGPSMQENCVDGADNNCDGMFDMADADCVATHDLDADGYCPLGTDLDKNGECTGPGENQGNDCNDQVAEINSGALESEVRTCKDKVDNDCDGKTDQADEGCRQFVDDDQDGFCEVGRDTNFNRTCLDSGEQTSARDCDDTTKAAFPGRREICDDAIDNDCNGKVDALDSTVCDCTTDEQCASSDPCMMGVCTNGACELTPVCVDAGMPMADAAVGEMPMNDAGMEAPFRAPDPPRCSVRGAGQDDRSTSGWLCVFGLSLGMFVRRRERARARLSGSRR